MVKMMSIVKRPEGKNLRELRKWWVEEHTKLSTKIPGIRRYVINIVADEAEGMSEIDGINELYFDDMAAVKKALDSPEFAEAMKDAREFGLIVVDRIFAQKHTIIP